MSKTITDRLLELNKMLSNGVLSQVEYDTVLRSLFVSSDGKPQDIHRQDGSPKDAG